MVRDPLDTAQRLLAGDAHPFFRARRLELMPLLSRFIDLDAPPFPESTLVAQPPTARLLGAERPAMVDRAQLLFRALLSGRTEDVEPLLAERIWALSRDGPASYTTRDELLARLETTRSRPKGVPHRLRSYTTGEIKSRWPEPIGAALEALLGGQSGLYVVGTFETGAAAIIFGPGPSESWMAHSFLMPAWDGPVAESAPISSDEHDGVRAADRLVRALTLGLPATVRTLTNLVMPRLLFGGRVTTVRALVKAAAAKKGLGQIEIGFSGTRRLSNGEVESRVPKARRRFVANRAPQIWYDKPNHLGLVWCETTPFRWKDGEVSPLGAVQSVMLRRTETDVSGEPVVRYRVGGVFTPDVKSGNR